MARPEFFQRFEKKEEIPLSPNFPQFWIIITGRGTFHHSPLILFSSFISDMQLTSIWNHFIHSFLPLPCRTSPPFPLCIFFFPLIIFGTSHLFSHLIISRVDLRHESYTLLLTVICNPLSLRIVSFIRSSPTLTFSLLPFHSPASHRWRLSYS